MITAWRLVKSKYKKSAFTGAGSNFASGRWHNLLVPIVYTSDSQALATLEQFVHLQEDGKNIKFVLIEINIPPRLIFNVEDIATLPKRWRSQPPGAGTKKIGSDWYRSSASAVLSVPSAIAPEDRNYLLNPHHPDFMKIKIGESIPFSLDPRMWK